MDDVNRAIWACFALAIGGVALGMVLTLLGVP